MLEESKFFLELKKMGSGLTGIEANEFDPSLIFWTMKFIELMTAGADEKNSMEDDILDKANDEQ